jgi:hypothetical protein
MLQPVLVVAVEEAVAVDQARTAQAELEQLAVLDSEDKL